MDTTKTQRKRGAALLVSLAAVTGMMGMSLALFYTAMADDRQSKVNEAMIAATALAEGATEEGRSAPTPSPTACTSTSRSS